MSILLTPATASAVLLLAAALLQSASLMGRKLPAARRPRRWPTGTAVDVVWIVMFVAGMRLAWELSTSLGLTAVVLYFAALPFAFQPPMARMLGFARFRDYLEAVARK